MKIYTRKGDDGTTGLLYGGRIEKDDLPTEAYGTLDEAVAAIGLARSMNPVADGLEQRLLDVQRELFVAGAELATAKENSSKLKPGISKVTDEMVTGIEAQIDLITEQAPLPDYFIVPGTTSVSAALDLARSVVRRAERVVVSMKRNGLLADEVVLRYLNRLSDFLFAAARYEEQAAGAEAEKSRED